MEISLNKISRKFNYEWIFRDIDFVFETGNKYAILGSNGSGKSTLLQIISGHLHPTQGNIRYAHNNNVIPIENIYQYITYSGPYLELIEEFTLREMIEFHQKFRSFQNGLNPMEIIELTGLAKNRDKAIKYFSSGMKQRVRLALAILTKSEILLLDEPAANLDRNAIIWYRNLISEHAINRITIVCSNSINDEYDFCSETIVIDDYKKKPGN